MVSEQERLCTQKSYLLSQCEKIDLTAVNRNLTGQHSHPNAAFVETANTRLQHAHTHTHTHTHTHARTHTHMYVHCHGTGMGR